MNIEMGDYRKITRSSLYDSESEYESNNDDSGNPMGYMPNIEFEFVEVDNSNEPEPTEINESKDNIDETQEEQDDEFEFPLFAAPPSTISSHQSIEANKMEDEEASRGRTKDKVMKVSLREASVEVIENERPLSYYMATYTDKDKSQFITAAVTADDIYDQIEIITPVRDPKPWKCIDLSKYNLEVEREIQNNKLKDKSRNRAGKKKRLNIIACRERKLERKKVDKKLQKEIDAKIKKKMFHKRGGKKHKKTADPAQSKPKYRTE
ncbi:unnamed protein product [Debaryomyces tyrocola]|nr:unnamed protein product [Debaryomyces tyrocola]